MKLKSFAFVVLGVAIAITGQLAWSAATANEYAAIAESVSQVASKMKQAKYLAEQVLANNSAQGADWNSQEAADALTAAGVDYTPAEISNAIGSLSTFTGAGFWNTHGGNFEQLAKPIE